MANLTSSQASANAKIKDYQNKIRNLRSKLLNLTDLKRSSTAKRLGYINSILNTRELYKAEMISNFPDLANQDIFATINALPSNHPIYLRWLEFLPEVQALETKISALETQLAEINQSEITTGAELQTTFAKYQDIFATAASQGLIVESPQDFQNILLAESALPAAQEDSLLAHEEDLNVLDLLNEDAHAVLTLEESELEAKKESRRKVVKWLAFGAGALFLLS
jgi:hypothetical protein